MKILKNLLLVLIAIPSLLLAQQEVPEKYWLDEYVYYNKLRSNPSSTKNIFVRSNADFTQFLVIRPETVRNPKKLVRSKFKPSNSNEVEEWLSFKKNDVETYNVKNGKYYKVK